jgi:hypothetical protein
MQQLEEIIDKITKSKEEREYELGSFLEQVDGRIRFISCVHVDPSKARG